MNKINTILLITLFIITSILFFSHPIYTGFITVDNCDDGTLFVCEDYQTDTECIEDICAFSCYHDGIECLDYIESDCQDIEDETECEIAYCEWIDGNCTELEYIEDEPLAETENMEDVISQLTIAGENPDKSDITNTLNIDLTTAIQSLNTILAQIQAAEADTTLTQAEKEQIILDQELLQEQTLADLPKRLTVESKITNLPATPVEDITEDMIIQNVNAEPDEIYYLQEQLQAKANIIKFSMITYSDEALSGTYIKKTISSPFSNGYIVEIIPHITSQSEIITAEQYDVLSLDPFTISLPLYESTMDFSYIILQDITQQIMLLQTAVIPFESEVEKAVQVTCGDGICTEFLEDSSVCPEDCARKVPWTFIIAIIIIIIIIILVLHFFKDKLNISGLKNLFKKKPKTLFSSETDRENLKSYIKRSLDENITEEKIKNVLLAKGWNKEQLQSIFNEFKKPKESEYRESVMEKEAPEKEEPEEDSDLEI